jgi:hypothetical protein
VYINSRRVTPVLNPALAPVPRWWLRRLIDRKSEPGRKIAVEFFGPLALIIGVFGCLLTGMSAPWLVTTVAAAIMTFIVRHEIPTGGLFRYRRDFVDPSELDSSSLEQLKAVQRTAGIVLSSEVYGQGELEPRMCAEVLKQHEWEIACRLRDITLRRTDYTRSVSSGRHGPQTTAVLDAHLRAITIAHEAITRRVAELTRYAEAVQAADFALLDWRTAKLMSERNPVYLELVARSAADEHALAEITLLTEQADRTHDLFEACLSEATIAALPLVLPFA